MRREIILWIIVAMLAASNVVSHMQILSVQEHQNDALRSIICRAEHVVRRSSGYTLQQRKQAIRFYRQSLADAHLKPCD